MYDMQDFTTSLNKLLYFHIRYLMSTSRKCILWLNDLMISESYKL